MKVSEYIPPYGLMFNFEYQIAIDHKKMSVNEMFENYPDFELTDAHIDLLFYNDLFSLQKVLRDDYFTPDNVTLYLRDLLDNFRQGGGDPLEWLQATFESVNMNPQNYRVDLITTIEKALIEWISIFEKLPFDHLFHVNNPEAINTQPEYNDSISQKKYTAKQHLLAYLIELSANGESYPVGQKRILERIGSERIGVGKGNTFYKAFNEVVRFDLNSEINLIEIGGENWRSIVIELSKTPKIVDKYLKDKQL